MSELHIEGFKGTQGKWMIDPHNLGTRWNIESETGVNVAIASQVTRRGELTERDANAKLIATSPELLDNLMCLLNAVNDVCYHGGSFNSKEFVEIEDKSKAIVKKALGE